MLPTPGKPPAELIRGLEVARAQSRRMLAPFRDADLRVRFFAHPRLGAMTLCERMAQLADHELKHLTQMERALARSAGTA